MTLPAGVALALAVGTGGLAAGAYVVATSRPRPSALPTWWSAGAGCLLGALMAQWLHDPGWLGVGAVVGWLALPWMQRRQRRVLMGRLTRHAGPFLQAVHDALEVGGHPLSAIDHAAAILDPESRRHTQAWVSRVLAGDAPASSAMEWADALGHPALKVFAALCAAWIAWGLDLAQATARLVREVDAQSRARAEVQVVRSAHEWLSWVLIFAMTALAVVAVVTWPKGLTPPWESPWGRGLFTAMISGTIVALWLPDTLGEDLSDDGSGPPQQGGSKP